jgi:hypothetical protein
VPRNAKKLEKQRQKRLTIFMAINYIKSSKKISSRDATMYFGYSADHVAYLIRNGKINGKKIYTKEAWKVSKKDLLEYLEERNKKFSQKGFFGILNGIRYFFKKYLSLKEASAISGYAPDYIGYLVRQEKIRGKKVYFGASWVTTKDAVKKYLDGKPPRKYQKPVTLSFPFWKKEKYFSFKIAKSGIFAALLIVFLSGWVLANSNQNQNQFVNIYPSQIQNIPKDNQAWKNEKKAIGPANVEPKGTLEYFSELNSAVYGGGAGSLFLSSFNETEFDLEMQDFGEKIKKESEEKKEESPGDIQQPAAETVETEESVEEEKSAETGKNSALEAGAGEENEFSEVEKQSGDFSEENPKQDNTQKEALESEDYSEAEEESEPEDLLLAEDGKKEQKQAEEDATREEEVQGEDLQPQNQSGVLSETQNQSQEQSSVPLPDAGEEQVSFLEKIKNLFGKSTAKAGELLNFKEASQKNLISAKIKISLASGVKSSDIIPIESQISAGSKQGGFWEKIKGAFGFFKKQAPQIAKAQKDAGSFEEDQPEPIALPATEGETGGQEEGMKEEEYAGEEEDGQEQPVEYTGELSQEDPKQEEEAEQLEQPESQGQEKESGEEKNLTADAGLGQEEIQLESEAEQEKKEKDEQAKDLEKEENQEKEENPQPQTDQELFEQSKEETILPNPDDKVIIWYSLDGEEWIKLYSLSQDYFSNNSNGGYLSLEAPFLNSWEDIENLQIKIEGAAGGDLASPVYLDSFWIEAEYNEEPLSEDFELVALKKDWAASEEPVFELRDLKEQKIGFAQKLFASAVSTFNGQEAETETQIKAALIGPSEKKRNLKEGKEFEKDKNSGGETIKISRPESFKPGLHTFKLSVEKYGKTYSLEQDFTWGVLVVNSNKSIYSPGEKAYLQMGVLDEEGNTVCDAELELEIIAPDGSKTILKTDGPGKFIAASQNPLEKIESEDFEEKDEQAEESFKEDSDKFNSAGQSVGLEESYVEPEEKEEQQEDSSSEEEIDFFQPEKADLDSSQEKDKDIEDAGILTEESQSQAAADDNIDSENLLPVQEGEADAIEEFADIEAQESLEGVQPPEENLQISEEAESDYERVEADEDSMKKETLEESQKISDAEPEDLLSKIKKNISQNLLMGAAYAAPMDPPAFDEQGNEVYLPGLSGNLKKSLDSGEYLPASGGGDIYYSGKCGRNNIVDVPDYFAYYDIGQAGEYKIKLTARTANGEYTITDSFEARDWVAFDVERIGPTRIYPPADYQMKLTIKANEDFKGEIVETVPANFQILNNKIQNIKFEESENVSNSNFRVLNISNKEKKLIWSNVVLKQGDTIEIDYAFNAPDISPYIYFLGPMGMEKLANTGVLVSDADGLAKPAERKSQIIFQEIRQWQIASDATGYDVKVQRNITDFGASEDSLAVNIDSVSATSSAFARLTDVVMKSGGLSAGSTATKNNDDVGASILLTATNQITVYRESTGENADYRTAWEVWEYTGSPGGANEFIVRYQDHITMASGQQDQTVSGISNINNCVPFVTGIRNTGVSVDFDDMTVTAEMYESEGTNYVRLKREGTGGTTYVSVAVVEFTGSNWTVQNNISHKFSAAAANETETINNVSDWTKAFIISSYRTGNGEEGLEEQGWNTWPKDSDEIYFRLRTGADNVSTKNYYVIANVIQNSELTVQHIDSITGSGTEHEAGSASPQTINETINTVASTTATGLFSTHDCTGSATAFPRPMWNYFLTEDDNVEYWRGYHGQPGDWALQVIQFPEATSSGTSSITVSGTVFTDEGSTTSTVGSVINLAIDGVWTASTTASTTDGSYTLDTGTATMATGTVLTIYTSNAAELGNTVTRYLGSGDVAGLDIYQNHIIVRHEDDGPITITDLDQYDTDDDATYMLYTANAGAGTLTVNSTSTEFFVWTGDTFSVGDVSGAISLAGVDINGTFIATSTQTVSVSGDWDATGGTFTSASSTVQFTATTTGKTITVNENPFYNLTFNGSGGEWTLQDAATTTNDLTITAGTALSSYDMAVQGGDVTGDGVLYWTGTSSFLVRGTGNFGGSTLWRFYDLIFGDGNEATTTNPGSDYILIGNSLTIASNHTLNAGSATWDLAGQGTPFIVNGTFNSQTSVLYYSSPWDTNITATNYYDLKLQPYLVFSDNFETGNLSLWDGTFTSSGSILEATSAQVYSGNYSTGFKVGGADGNAHMEKDYLGEAQTSIVDFYLYIPSDFSWGTASAINIMGFSDNSWNDRFSMMIEDWGNIRLTYNYWDSIGSRHWTDGGTYLSKDHWYHIKGEDYVDSSNGYIKIWIDDALFVNNTGINTGSTSIDNIYGGSTWADGSHSLLYEDNIVFYNVPTYTLGTTGGQNITVNHDFILGNGTDGVHLDSAAQNPSIDVNGSVLISTSSALIAPTSSSFTVAGDWSNFGTFTNSTGTVTFDASSTGKTIEAGNSSFHHFVFDNASGGWTVASDATSTNNWSITNAAAFELSASKTIEVGGQYSIGDSAPSATTWNSGSVLYLNNETAYTVGSKTQSQEAYAILQVGADTDIRTWNSSAATSTVDASGSLYSMNHGNVSGSAYIWGDFHTNANDYLSYANDFDGTPGANRQCQLTLASGAAITIDNGDNLEIKGGGTSSDDITTVSYAPASGSWNFNNNSGSETIIQEASLGYIDFVNGTTTVINTILNNETVTSTGVLNVDWYLGAHLVDKDNESGNVDTDGEGITISEASSTAVIYQHSGSAWIGPVSSTTTDSGADGKNPQPNSSLAIRIREYQKTAAETTYYKYNLAVSSGAGFSAYNYFNDYGSSYITSASSSESSGVDKCISESWQRDAIGAMNTPYSSVNEMPENGSWYVGMASDLQFSIDSASVNLGTLSAGNNWTGTGATILSATTSYPGGYSITAYASNDGRLRLGATGNYINRWDYANSTPALWSTNCEDNDSYCGFGYTTDDITLGGTGDEDRFGSGTKYAGFATTSPGDIVADSTTTAFGATTTVSYKVSAKSEYADGEYNTTVYYLCTVNY